MDQAATVYAATIKKQLMQQVSISLLKIIIGLSFGPHTYIQIQRVMIQVKKLKQRLSLATSFEEKYLKAIGHTVKSG